MTKLLFLGATLLVRLGAEQHLRGFCAYPAFCSSELSFCNEGCLFVVITNAPQRFHRHLIFRPCLAEPRKKFSTVKVLRLTTNLAVFLLVPQLFFSFPSLASQFFWIRQTTNRALCISSFWQALKVLTNDSLIQRKTGGGEGETDKNNRLPQPWGA